jgi:hypothetical protein
VKKTSPKTAMPSNKLAWVERLKKILTLQRVIGSKIIYTPLLAIILFVLVMGVILGTLQLQERQQQEGALFRELALVQQRIQLRFVSNGEIIESIARDLGNSQGDTSLRKSVLEKSLSFVMSNQEVVQIMWLNENEWRQWMIPAASKSNEWLDRAPNSEALQQQLRRAIYLSRETNRASYSQMVQLQFTKDEPYMRDYQSVFWEVVPTTKNGEISGALAVLYSGQGILNYIIPSEIKNQYRFSLINQNNEVLAISSDRDTPFRALSSETTLDFGALGPNVTLRVDTYPPPTNLTLRMLLGVVICLSLFVVWSLWSVLKQIQVRQQTEANLRTETSFRRVIEDSTPIGIRAHDMEKRITYVNRSFSELTGWQPEELIGLKPPFPFWPAEHQEELMEKMEYALSSNDKRAIDGTIQKRDGTRIATRTFVAPLINEKGQQTGWVTSLIDVSEPKRIREELTATQERFVTVLEGLDAAVSVVSIENGDLLFANRYYRERFGETSVGHIDLAGHEMDPSSMMGLGDDTIDALAGLPASILEINRSSETQEIQLRSDANRWYEVRRRFIPWVDGHLAQLLIATDITLRKNTEALARQQEERMQFTSRLTTMGEMASSLAHELNQPLSAITNYCNGIAKRLSGSSSDLAQELLPALKKASEQAHRAGTIIQRIRSFVKRSEPQNKLSRIEDIIADAVGLIELEANRQGFKISSELDPRLPEIELDPILIQQVLVNLLKNAIDSMRDTYPSSARWTTSPIKIKADIESTTATPMLRIQVSDSGGGISAVANEKMFEPFFSTKTDGMGMGLNICRSIIESHHGRLWAQNLTHSETQRLMGCTFTILLPLEFSTEAKKQVIATKMQLNENPNESKQSLENEPN